MRNKFFYQHYILGFILCFSVNLSQAETLPLWELGLGLGGLHQAYYTGTKQERSTIFPIVFPVYRGEVFKSDDKGMRAQIFDNNRVKLDVSLDFSFSVDSDDIDLRQGMNDIGNLLEIGPSLEFTIFEGDSDKWFLKFPFRAVTEIDDTHFSSSGYNFSPALTLEKTFLNTSLKLGFSASVQFGTEEYNAIYYRVAPSFATLERRAYEVDSGYSGNRLQLALTSKTKKYLAVLFLRYDNINGAVIEDSPLVETNDNLTLGFIYNWYVFKSKTTIQK